ncbi:MAG: GNAT family N-acetyltransferase [Colwellia sp.]|nr:GNAT family N-acetyltransferase [Colwellia sp.]
MFKILPAKKENSALILQFIKELAVVEEFPFEVSVTRKDLENNLFSDTPEAQAIICYQDNRPCGFAVFYFTFSTTTGKRGLHLDDLYIQPEYQGQGQGKKVLIHLAKLARKKSCARFEWWALRTNVAALKFYQKIGAKSLNELLIFRLNSAEIINLSNEI